MNSNVEINKMLIEYFNLFRFYCNFNNENCIVMLFLRNFKINSKLQILDNFNVFLLLDI